MYNIHYNIFISIYNMYRNKKIHKNKHMDKYETHTYTRTHTYTQTRNDHATKANLGLARGCIRF